MSKSLAQLDDLIGALSQPGAAAASEPPAGEEIQVEEGRAKEGGGLPKAGGPAAPAAAAPPDPEVERKYALVSSVGEEA